MKNLQQNFRKCSSCNTKLIGRRDKVFCSIKCKNEHHKIARIQTKKIQAILNKRIRRNYVVLEGIFSVNTKSILIHKNVLFEYGFDINSWLNKIRKGNNTFFKILDYEFRFLKHGIIEIKRKAPKKHELKKFISRWLREFPVNLTLSFKKYKDGIIKYFKRTDYFNTNHLTDKLFIHKE